MPDLLERATGGRIISLSDKGLNADEIYKIHNHPYCICPNPGCIEGTLGMMVGEEDGVVMLGFIMCPVCEGRGQVKYMGMS